MLDGLAVDELVIAEIGETLEPLGGVVVQAMPQHAVARAPREVTGRGQGRFRGAYVRLTGLLDIEPLPGRG